MSPPNRKPTDDHPGAADVAIIGGGLVGLTLGIGLAANGLKTTVIDRAPLEDGLDAAFDGRSSAIAYASQRLLEGLGIWDHLDGQAEAIREIRVSDGPSRLFLHFDHREVGGQGGSGPLGFMVENRHNRQALAARAGEIKSLTILAPEQLRDMSIDKTGVRLDLASGKSLRARLVVGAEGRASPSRQQAGIPLVRWSYHQVAIVATIQHELPHMGIAHERFLPPGPFAILPLTGNRSSLVWTVAEDNAPDILELSERAFAAEIQKRVGDFLGKVTVIDGRWHYPLGLQIAGRYIDDRLALVGDAAHGMHPIAGQGLNLGLRDVAALIEVLVEAERLGLDIGAADILERYQRWRRTDGLALLASTDGLNRLFSNDAGPVRLARDLGLGAVNRLPPLKRFFMRHARGTIGDLPRLLKGEPV